jgi:hypothetical protein
MGAAFDVVHGGGGCSSGCGPFVYTKEHPALAAPLTTTMPTIRAPIARMFTLLLANVGQRRLLLAGSRETMRSRRKLTGDSPQFPKGIGRDAGQADEHAAQAYRCPSAKTYVAGPSTTRAEHQLANS